ncbi:MAG TPA: Mini-ribonuclease 3 [Clostridia bacterium]|nr:Mini-ribonuclease 3 [Clostridia bacterium]
MDESIFGAIRSNLNVKQEDVKTYSPLVLAYAGDAVYELYIRTYLISKGNAPVHKLHKQSISFVKAKAQSDTIHSLMEVLTPEEQDVVRRGRNAKSGTIPKNADVTDYKYATGFESLLGYLYLKADYTRLQEVLRISLGQSQGARDQSDKGSI